MIAAPPISDRVKTPDQPEAVAIVGLAGRFPQARNLAEFWRNLRNGVEAVSFFTDEQVEWLPIEHPPRLDDPHYVKARAVLERPEWFDAAFFQMNPREAAIMDPQHRVFLECAWEALENAGCNPDTYPGLIGVFAGASMNTYLFTNLLSNRGLVEDYGLFAAMIMNNGDFVPTRVSYKFNLRGPSLNVQTACSTSLVAVSLAAQNLLDYRCDVALAGGVSITFPAHRGQYHQEGGILSPDGHCRTFDAQAAGTVLGDGAGVVVLKRLSEARADGDTIYAVIKGTAINNDGSAKIGYTAPSSAGQAEVIALAHAEAQVEPSTISYVEAHGTGTPLGDPIEIEGLTKAFGARSGQTPHCAVGSVKSNIGHLDVAAGVAGLIKTVLALQHREIPPSLHFETPNPKIDFAGSPFFVNHTLRPWPAGRTPRRAGVSSFGIGGTNAHVVLEEAPALLPSSPARPHHLLVLSARTETALETATDQLAAHLEAHPEVNLADVAFTLQTGRKVFAHRRALVCDDVAGAVQALQTRDPKRLVTTHCNGTEPGVAFLFPGQGAQAVDMARELYETEPTFRADVDRSCELLRPRLGLDLRSLIFPVAGAATEATERLTRTQFTQPALFVIEHALARLWMSWGVKPQAMLGHSLGEYVAACLAGVFTLEEALALVAERARGMAAQPGGAMVAVRLPEAQVLPLLGKNLALAAVNAPGLSVVSGPFDAIDALEQRLVASAIPFKRLTTSHAFHSAMMEPAMPGLADFLRRHGRGVARPPTTRWVSNVTGDWITPAQAADPNYWTQHLRAPVRFADGVGRLVEAGCRVLLEVGPGQTLAGLVRQHPATAREKVIAVSSLGRSGEAVPARAALMHAMGALWCAGVPIVWREGFYQDERRRVIPLPTYPFERKRHWIEPAVGSCSGPRPSGNGSPSEAPAKATEPVEASSTIASEPATGETGALPVLRKLLHDLSGVNLDRAPAATTFFELGFDSLFLTQASRAVARHFGVEVTFRQLREDFPSLGTLAAHLDTQRTTEPGAHAADGPSRASAAGAERGGSTRLALTEFQREIWFASQLGDAMSAAYNESSIVQLDGALNLGALTTAMHEIVARHESLRATFSAPAEEQVIHAAVPVDLKRSSVASRPADERAAAVTEVIQAELKRPFDLEAGAFRFLLVELEPQRHVLAVIVHHIACDGWSLGVLLRELGELYSAKVGSRPARLSGAPSFVQYVRERATQPSTAAAAARDFWQRQFADTVPVLELPTDRPRSVARTYEAGFVLGALPRELAVALKQFCAARQCTPFGALLAAFTVLIHRLSGQDDIVIGIPSTAQVMDGQEHLVGHFANLLPIRSRVAPEENFGQHLEVVSGAMTNALEYWHYPFSNVVRQLGLGRDASRVPLAPVVFNTTRRRGALAFEGLTAAVVGNPKPFVNFDLNFNFALDDDGLTLGCYYSTELFDEATIRRWFGHFETLLRDAVVRPAAGILDLPLLSAAETRQIVHDWNAAVLPYDRTTPVHALFEAQVRRTPDAIAVVTATEQITYAQLNDWADRIAATLRPAGVGPDVLVGVLVGRKPELLAAILGVLKAGGAYVPLDPVYPVDRLEFIVTDTRMPVLLTERGLASLLPAAGVRRVVIEEERTFAPGRDATASASASLAPVTGSNLAYVIYTSGSTGRPKGVAIEQHCVTALVAWARELYRSEELTGILFSTSASFDISIFEIFCSLCLGGKAVLADDILHLGTHPAANEVTFLSGVPSAVAEVVRARLVPASVRTVALAGETFPQALVEALYDLPHIERVFEHYGPTETTVYSTGSLRRRDSRPTIGRPFPNEQIYVLDSRLQPVPIGVAGEIYIGGDKLARCYLHRPELTAEKFVTVPFLPGQRLYRTGDMGRFYADGSIESLGRADFQVKVRGYRIELGEIESILRQQAAVADCTVISRPDSAGHNRLLAYWVPVDGATVARGQLRAALQECLPDYMIPAAFVSVSALPQTANGKLDRRALPDPEFGSTASEVEAPRTTTEELLVDIWREVLGVRQVGVHDNFFELGGHSLLATQVLTRVQDVLGVELTLGQFFFAPTAAGLSQAVEEALIGQIITSPDPASPAGELLATAKE